MFLNKKNDICYLVMIASNKIQINSLLCSKKKKLWGKNGVSETSPNPHHTLTNPNQIYCPLLCSLHSVLRRKAQPLTFGGITPCNTWVL